MSAMTKRFAVVALSAMLALGLAACGGDDDDDDSGGEPGSNGGGVEAAVTIEGFEFDVRSAVAPGADFTVANGDDTEHTFTADDGAFDTDLGGGEEKTVTAPDEAGDYAFHCTIHPNMTGTLTVE